MLKTGADLFLRLSGDSGVRTLNKGTVIWLEGNLVTLELEEPEGGLPAEPDVLVYYELERQFVRQSAIIEDIVDTGPRPVVRLALVGDPIAAESRRHHRVTTISAGVTATVWGEKDCEVLDISPVGFAVMATQNLSAGQVVPVSVRHGEEEYSGSACVQSFLQYPRGRWRYGLRFARDQQHRGNLEEGLNRISLEIQRERLGRT